MYYNTNKLNGDELKIAEMKSLTQEALIKLLLESNKDTAYSPFELQEQLVKLEKNWPITSIRRALTNLTKRNIAVKTKETVIGDYGSPNYRWQYNKEQ